MDAGVILTLPPTHTEAVRRTGPRVMRTDELALLLTGCNIAESRPCISSGKHSSAGTSRRGVGEPPPKGKSMEELALPLVWCEVAWV